MPIPTIQVWVWLVALKRSQTLWNGEKSQLLLSFISPQKENTSSIVSRWIKETLKLSGVTKSVNFSRNSTWSASTSKAEFTGPSVLHILKRGSWSSLHGKAFTRRILLLMKTCFKLKFLSQVKRVVLNREWRTVTMYDHVTRLKELNVSLMDILRSKI